MVKFSTICAGDVLYDVHTTRMGNTTLRTVGAWEVKVIEVDEDGKGAWCSWNGKAKRTGKI